MNPFEPPRPLGSPRAASGSADGFTDALGRQIPYTNSRQRRINADQIDVNNPDEKYCCLQGKIAFSRIAAHVSPQEARSLQKNRKFPIAVPYTVLSISQARVLPCRRDQKSILECYVEERFFPDSSGKSNPRFLIENKAPLLPPVYVLRDRAARRCEPVTLEGELAPGQEVLLYLSAYAGKNGGRNGVGIAAVLLLADPVYYSPHQNSALDHFGFTVTPPKNSTPQRVPDPARQESGHPETLNLEDLPF